MALRAEALRLGELAERAVRALRDRGHGVIASTERERPCTVVLDNASAHVARAFKGRRGELAAVGVDLFHLPPRSPELNIERVWRSAKYDDHPVHSHTATESIGMAVDQALTRQRIRIRGAAKGSATNFTKAA